MTRTNLSVESSIKFLLLSIKHIILHYDSLTKECLSSDFSDHDGKVFNCCLNTIQTTPDVLLGGDFRWNKKKTMTFVWQWN